jgi:Family of unknown function (DUF6459)
VTASRNPTETSIESDSFVSPIVDYEPAPLGEVPPPCPPPSPAALHRHTPRPLRPTPAGHVVRELPPPRSAAVFADAALRRVLEVADRRRPIAALRPLLTPPLVDAMVALSRTPSKGGSAVLRRVRVRTAEVVDGEATAAEVFGTYTRGHRVHALAGRIEVVSGRWRVVALQVG